MGITEILRKIWLFSANKIKISESFSKDYSTHHRIQLIIAAHNCHNLALQALAYDGTKYVFGWDMCGNNS